MTDRRLIVNADDLGYADWVDVGIFAAHDRGIVTSASLMVRQPAAARAVAGARRRPRLDLGLHLDLGEWAFLAGAWHPIEEVVDLDDAGAVEAEVHRQLARFHELVGRAPSHLDSHQHVHRRGPAARIVANAGAELGVPVRAADPGHLSAIRWVGSFYGQTDHGTPLPELITVEALIALVTGLPPGVTEVSCHPGDGEAAAAAASPTMYRVERTQEVRVLSDPRVRAALDAGGVRLTTFAEVTA